MKLWVFAFGFILVLAGLVFFLGGSGPAYALGNISNMSIMEVTAFQNQWVPGDQLFIIEYNMDYQVQEGDHAATLFQATMSYTTDSELIQLRPIVYFNHSIISLYLPVDKAVVWGVPAYTFTVEGRSYYWPNLSEGVTKASWTANCTWKTGVIPTSRTYLRYYCLQAATALSRDEEWYSTPLLDDAETRFSSEGEVFFNNVIPDLGYVCPDLFTSAMYIPVYEDYPYDATYEQSLLDNAPSRLRTAMDNLGEWIGFPGLLVGGICIGLIFILLAGRVYVATGSPAAGAVLALPVLIVGMLLGLIPMTIILVIGLIIILLVGIVFVLARFP